MSAFLKRASCCLCGERRATIVPAAIMSWEREGLPCTAS
jgi:hypothetical protein